MTINLRCMAKLIILGILIYSYGFASTAQGVRLGSIVVYSPESSDNQQTDLQVVKDHYDKSVEDCEFMILRTAELFSQNVKNGISSWHETALHVEPKADLSIAEDIAKSLENGVSDHVITALY